MSLAGGVFVSGDGQVSAEPWVAPDDGDLAPTSSPGARHWLGPGLWGNRLQDWQHSGGRIECLRGEAGYELRTVAVLTRELVAGGAPGHLGVTTGIAGGADGDGFAGLLLGIGGGDIDYRAAALAQRSSGSGGGLLCTYETDGRVRVREHTDEDAPVTYEERPADAATVTDAGGEPAADDRIRLAVDLLPQADGRFTVQVKALDADGRTVLARAARRDVPEESLRGGIALVSSPMPGEDGTRWWFSRFETGGGKIETRPERTFGPIAGTLYSLDDDVMKLSAQLFPMGDGDPESVWLQYRPADTDEQWRTARTTAGPGHSASFRIDGWDSSRAWDYRVVYQDGTGTHWDHDGRIEAEPADADELTIGLLSCTNASARRLDTPRPIANSSRPGRYTSKNIYIPYPSLTDHLRAHHPDLLVAVGDQLYEWRPTRAEGDDEPTLDYLYKWFMWLWSFRDLTRNTPTIVLVDDHDVYQANIWGAGGQDVPAGDLKDGGYARSAAFINLVQDVQCGHNPDPYDPTPVDRGIGVYYGAFTYGGTSFAMLEDRKFKTAPGQADDLDEDELELLGDRQEQFLADWAGSEEASPKVCLTQTIFASALTTPEGDAKVMRDTNGWPKRGRDRAVERLREAGALVLAGDQHLPTLVRHGLDTYTDGVVQFTGPAGASNFPRWFEPADPLPNDRGHPYTGEFTDAFGNKFRMLAVANPEISRAEFERDHQGAHLYDRDLRSDGYGIVRVDYEEGAFDIECWPWDADPAAGGEQFPGWPYRLPFAETDGRQ